MIRTLGPTERLRYAIDRAGEAVLYRSRDPFRLLRCAVDSFRPQWSASGTIADYAWKDVHHRYRHEPYPGPIDVFTADKPDWPGYNFDDPTMGWGSVVQGEVRVHHVAGNHEHFVKLPWATDLGAAIRRCIDACRSLDVGA